METLELKNDYPKEILPFQCYVTVVRDGVSIEKYAQASWVQGLDTR